MAELRELPRNFERASSKSTRNIMLALVLSAGAHVGAMFPEKTSAAIERLPRIMRKLTDTKKPDASARAYLEKYAAKIEKNQPLDLDLKNFYLASELAAGGIAKDEMESAKKRFDDIVAKAEAMKQNGTSRDTVLSYLLEQQGTYSSGHSLLTDLLNKHAGNCEARQKFLSAGTQALYPDLVEAGKLKIEVFGAFKDAQGHDQPGHVRAIIEEADHVVVLEGGIAKREPKEKHNNIPKYEATQLAVKAFAAGQGEYDLEHDRFVTQESAKGHASTDRSKTSGMAVNPDSINHFPKSNASYSDTSDHGRESITPEFLKHERATLQLKITHRPLAELIKKPEAQKPDEKKKPNVDALITRRNGVPVISLDMSKRFDAATRKALEERLEKEITARIMLDNVTSLDTKTNAAAQEIEKLGTAMPFEEAKILIAQDAKVVDMHAVHAKRITVFLVDGGRLMHHNQEAKDIVIHCPTEKVFLPFDGESMPDTRLALGAAKIEQNTGWLEAGALKLFMENHVRIWDFTGHIGTVIVDKESTINIGGGDYTIGSVVTFDAPIEDLKRRAHFGNAQPKYFSVSTKAWEIYRQQHAEKPETNMSPTDWAQVDQLTVDLENEKIEQAL